MNNQLVLVIDFGGQYSHLIARRVRDHSVYCEIIQHGRAVETVRERKPVGVILTGGPNSVYEAASPTVGRELFELGVPVMGICYGAHLMAHVLGGRVAPAGKKEFGKTDTSFEASPLFAGVEDSVTWMSHGDMIHTPPEGFEVIASTRDCPVAAFGRGKLYAVQFHPEVTHTAFGREILKNFLYGVCGAAGDWSMDEYAKTMIADIRARVGDKRVLLGLSGGVDSAVAAALLSRAVGKKLVCIFVDHGLMRKDEGDEVEAAFEGFDLTLRRVNAGERFLSKLAGVSEPEAKRKIIGAEFIRVFEDAARGENGADFLAQGTIYPDVIESGGSGGAAVIKSHHNVGGLPADMGFEGVVEPLRLLFKDEVRRLGRQLGLPDFMVDRQPFPGPGLAIRIIGEVTEEKAEILREADAIFREEIANAGLAGEIHQYFAVLTDMRSVGVMGDFRTYDYTLALRGVTTTDFMTADFARIPYDVLAKVCTRVVNEVGHINRIVYDVTTKPPATIEWE
ncbi:GMP synthase [glutamine-hydrolyzing] [Clostridia bacterium]|nr:GMP synthase [glutamine-hydrolyzing] [Clostridia bacterium]GHV35110.1 GMP synthase [glutamine-hydrolyzing] [Clostridia bacterium]